MNTEKVTIGQNPPQAIVVMPGVVTLPFNVASDLNQYSRIFITHEYDYFRVVKMQCEIIRFLGKHQMEIKNYYLQHINILNAKFVSVAINA